VKGSKDAVYKNTTNRWRILYWITYGAEDGNLNLGFFKSAFVWAERDENKDTYLHIKRILAFHYK
jgi:hypothetical protein